MHFSHKQLIKTGKKKMVRVGTGFEQRSPQVIQNTYEDWNNICCGHIYHVYMNFMV